MVAESKSRSSDIVETDYLVIGTGATAMAFVDTLLSESDAGVVMVDRHHRAGGHWNDSYPFVRLHAPSALYGVASRAFGSAERETVGFTAGQRDRALGTEILDYYDQVMRHRFVASGRVTWLPMTKYEAMHDGVHHARSLVSGGRHRFRVRRKLVDATLSHVEVPATHAPAYSVAEDVRLIPIGELPTLDRDHRRYTIVGSGKTGMEACLWLLEREVDPARIRWVRPREAWMLSREAFFERDFEGSIATLITNFRAMSEAASTRDLFAMLEKAGLCVRIDRTIEPTMFRCAVSSDPEIEQARRIRDVVRLGHVLAIEPGTMLLRHGRVEAHPDTLYVDCTARGVQPQSPKPAFDRTTINIVNVQQCLPLFSAALLAFIECNFEDEAKASLCRTVLTPERPVDWLHLWHSSLLNQARWRSDERIANWIARCRLDPIHMFLRQSTSSEARTREMLDALAGAMSAAGESLPRLLGQCAEA